VHYGLEIYFSSQECNDRTGSNDCFMEYHANAGYFIRCEIKVNKRMSVYDFINKIKQNYVLYKSKAFKHLNFILDYFVTSKRLLWKMSEQMI
jgi:hypothetical protein